MIFPHPARPLSRNRLCGSKHQRLLLVFYIGQTMLSSICLKYLPLPDKLKFEDFKQLYPVGAGH
jgi:hypothetical protein